MFDHVGASVLARLPLHSLKQPVRWSGFYVQHGVSLQEVRAAVANVTRRCPAGFAWGHDSRVASRVHLQHSSFLGLDLDVPAVLRALQPLLTPVTAVDVICSGWDAERVRALGEALPRACTCVGLARGDVPREALEQLARSLPWVRFLQIGTEAQVAPEDVVAYVRLVGLLKREGSGVCLEEVAVVCPEGVSEAEHKRVWKRAVRAVREESGGQVVLRTEGWLAAQEPS